MKLFRLVFFLVLALAAASFQSCLININGIKGSGVVTSVKRTVEPFTEIESSIGADIVLVKSSSNEILLEGEDNILPLIETSVRDKRLIIDTDKSFSSHKRVKIHVPFSELEAINLLGSGDVSSESPVAGERLSLRIAGSGNVKLGIFVKTLQTKISGSGSMDLLGRVEKHDARISGSGKIKALELQTLHTNADISGSGTCLVNASDELDAHISGSGDILFKNPPVKIHRSVSGSGNIRQID
jgi:hypothetical protein